jgi:hypothetical protein
MVSVPQFEYNPSARLVDLTGGSSHVDAVSASISCVCAELSALNLDANSRCTPEPRSLYSCICERLNEPGYSPPSLAQKTMMENVTHALVALFPDYAQAFGTVYDIDQDREAEVQNIATMIHEYTGRFSDADRVLRSPSGDRKAHDVRFRHAVREMGIHRAITEFSSRNLPFEASRLACLVERFDVDFSTVCFDPVDVSTNDLITTGTLLERQFMLLPAGSWCVSSTLEASMITLPSLALSAVRKGAMLSIAQRKEANIPDMVPMHPAIVDAYLVGTPTVLHHAFAAMHLLTTSVKHDARFIPAPSEAPLLEEMRRMLCALVESCFSGMEEMQDHLVRPFRDPAMLRFWSAGGGDAREKSRYTGEQKRVKSIRSHPCIYRALRGFLEMKAPHNITEEGCELLAAKMRDVHFLQECDPQLLLLLRDIVSSDAEYDQDTSSQYFRIDPNFYGTSTPGHYHIYSICTMESVSMDEAQTLFFSLFTGDGAVPVAGKHAEARTRLNNARRARDGGFLAYSSKTSTIARVVKSSPVDPTAAEIRSVMSTDPRRFEMVAALVRILEEMSIHDTKTSDNEMGNLIPGFNCKSDYRGMSEDVGAMSSISIEDLLSGGKEYPFSIDKTGYPSHLSDFFPVYTSRLRWQLPMSACPLVINPSVDVNMFAIIMENVFNSSVGQMMYDKTQSSGSSHYGGNRHATRLNRMETELKVKQDSFAEKIRALLSGYNVTHHRSLHHVPSGQKK